MKIAVFRPKHYYKNRPFYYQNGGNIFWAIHFYWGNYTLWQILKDQTVSLRQKKIIFTNIPFAILKTTKSSILSHVSSSPNPLLFPLESLQLGQQLICSNLLHSGPQFRPTRATPAFCLEEESCWLLISTGQGESAKSGAQIALLLHPY